MPDQERRQHDTENRGQLAELRADVSELSEKVEAIIEQQAAIMLRQDAQTTATAALVEAWNTGTGLVKFIKWAAVLSGSVATLAAVWHAGLSVFFDTVKQGVSK